jgi:hypothetical protein
LTPHALSGRSQFAKARNVRISAGHASGDLGAKKANEIKGPMAFIRRRPEGAMPGQVGLILAPTQKCSASRTAKVNDCKDLALAYEGVCRKQNFFAKTARPSSRAPCTD